MSCSLLDAPIHTELILIQVTEPALARWLQRLGLFVGSQLIRHDEEINFHPVRVRASRGDVVVPAGLAVRVFVHLDSGERKPLVEMARNETGHIETMSCGPGCVQALARLGIKEDTDITFIRSLPHMDYITVIDRLERTRLTEGEAARIWGESGDNEASQFYFAKRHRPFTVLEIIGGRKISAHLRTHGVRPGSELVLETIEQAKEAHTPGMEAITISSQGGLRLYLNPAQAARILVRDPKETAEGKRGGK
ncbi:FeoA family protein [Desulfobulbus alkaliphilus]|uniref:FeoA family protein n=1 Tax=Desulfobulbus alkaliphilus TaxID=869814 RepID=UPI0019631F65|nr:FeoA family protein [Desulfobulbus alkaliphilus]MBM9538700.1 FeoA domain-containing protein [Desulfobulbus alkaliphilus]